MKKLAKNFVAMALSGCAFFSVGFSPVYANDLTLKNADRQIEQYLSEHPAHETEREEFWRKFRESVTPREKNPEKYPQPPAPSPREHHPK